MNKSFGKDYTTGNIPRHLIAFIFPVLIGTMVQTSYSIINAIWVGQLLGSDAVGAIAIVFPITLILIALISGISTAASILIARNYGARRNDVIQKVVNNAWTLSVILIIITIIIGLLSSDSILRLLHTPDSIMHYASGYLKLIFISFCTMNISNLTVSTVRGVGDTKTPTMFLILSTIINAVLDPMLIIGIGPFPRMELNGAAVATLISGACSTIFGVTYLCRRYSKLPLRPRKLHLELETIKTLAKVGLPIFIQQTILSLGIGFVTTFVNSFGAKATAAFGAAMRVEMFLTMPNMAILMAVSTLTAQNLGAYKYSRIKNIFTWGIVISLSIITVFLIPILVFPTQIMGMFVKDPTVNSFGATYLRTICPAYILLAVSYVANGVINGSGKTFITMSFSFVSSCIIRIIAAWLFSRVFGLKGIWYGIVLSYCITFTFNFVYYLSGNWRKEKSKADIRVIEDGLET
ncbi:MAG: MATE family efflux transporter [Bacillota bacterium]|nr:MATE family efflux transporter [Bacillota bacterium]